MSMITIVWLTVAIYFFFMALIAIRILVRKQFWQRMVRILLIPVLIALVLMASVFYLRAQDQTSTKYAILLVDKVDVMGSPSEDATLLFSLHEGVKFRVEQFNDGWAKIRLDNGDVGWVKKDVFEII